MILKQQARRAGVFSLIAVAASLLSVLGVSATQAQNVSIPRSQAEFEQTLGLTAAQKTKLQEIGKKYQPQLVAISKKYQPEVVKLQQQMAALQKKAQAEAAPIGQRLRKEQDAVLTPAQIKKRDAIEAQVRAMQMQQMQQMQQAQNRKP